jgi:3D-(3,5/4)-trihydroxycyclohexane-1,2-dione acylhydrolase (decyclizing)
VIGVGTRWSDFTTASRTAYGADGVCFVNVNVAPVDTAKHAGIGVVADAREALTALTGALAGWTVPSGHRELAARLAADWDTTVQHAYDLGHQPLPAQSEVIGAVNTGTGPRDVVICAAGSMPGDLHKLWRTRDPKGYHVEYGYSCMGYEIAGGVGVALALRDMKAADTGETDRRPVVLVGDGSYLMMAQELVTAVQERLDLLVVLVQNHGFASIGDLSENLGSQRFGTRYRFRDGESGRLDGDVLPVDLAANAESLGVRVLRASGIDDFRVRLAEARAHTGGPVLVHVETDLLVTAPDSGSWWDVPVSEVSQIDSTRQARKSYEAAKAGQHPYLESRG